MHGMAHIPTFVHITKSSFFILAQTVDNKELA